MAFRHITSCIPHDQHKTFPQVLAAYAVPVGLIAAIVGAIAAVGLGATFPLAAALAYCDWWFHYRLVCIPNGEDQCAVGTVGRTDQSTGLGDPDLDFTINLVLAPILVDSHLFAAEQLPLLPPQHKRYLTRFFGDPDFDWSPDEITNLEAGSDDPKTTALHCEIEGDGMKAACAAATVGAVAGVAGGSPGDASDRGQPARSRHECCAGQRLTN
jgi:hypothetical protein